ncbi:hypothetical protein C1645_824164 [Glomus cerebriforme]|uniref:Uncharacterized protein n=1 Tax=Glomus cerebriforme TaxID=658196 RepID=A0A397SW60_9GLOM|nr:hypothetical protein C1645_824164 [Glomus cerebriforme]
MGRENGKFSELFSPEWKGKILFGPEWEGKTVFQALCFRLEGKMVFCAFSLMLKLEMINT